MEFLMNVLHWLGVLLGVVSVSATLLAPFMVRWVTVQEGTAVAFKYLGQFSCCVMSFAGHHFDPQGFVVSGSGPNRYGSCWCVWKIGGWVIYLRPFIKPIRYLDQNDNDGFGEGYCVRLGDMMPKFTVLNAETDERKLVFAQPVAGPPSKQIVNLKGASTMRVIHPYNWLILSPKQVNSSVILQLDAVMRGWVANGNTEHAQAATGNGAQLWSEILSIGYQGAFDTIKSWGLEIVPGSIILSGVDYDPEYEEALKASGRASLEARADTEATAGRILKMVARLAGVDIDDPDKLERFMQKIENDPTLRSKPAADGGYKEMFAYAEDQVMRDRAGDAGELKDIRIGGTHGSEIHGNLPAWVALGATRDSGGGNSDRRDNRARGGNRRRGGGSRAQGGGPDGSGFTQEQLEEELRRRGE